LRLDANSVMNYGRRPATAANGVGFNIRRAAGPALGGLVIAAFGIAVPFWIFAASNIGIIAALIWWRKPRNAAESLPAERLVSAVRAGIRHVANNPYLRATLIRVLAFFPFASAYLALLPLVARHQMGGPAGGMPARNVSTSDGGVSTRLLSCQSLAMGAAGCWAQQQRRSHDGDLRGGGSAGQRFVPVRMP
jgi:hypothetical protein